MTRMRAARMASIVARAACGDACVSRARHPTRADRVRRLVPRAPLTRARRSPVPVPLASPWERLPTSSSTNASIQSP
jgi:hypothetical protein